MSGKAQPRFKFLIALLMAVGVTVLAGGLLTSNKAQAQAPLRTLGAKNNNPAGLLTNTPSETATETPTDVPTDTPTDTPTETAVISATATSTTTPAPCDVVITGSLTASDPQQTGRLSRNGIASNCTTTKNCPGVYDTALRAYDSYTFSNPTNATICVQIRLDASGCGDGNDIFSAVYAQPFDPTNLCNHYLADIGGSPPPVGYYSLNVPAHTSFVVVVHEIYSGLGCNLYNLRISGLPCGGTVTPTPVTTPCAITFTDVQPTDYFYQAVQYLYCHGAISGYADNTFRPYNNTTRGQLSKIVALAEGWPVNTAGGPHFNDVPVADPFYTYVETAYNRGIISGYTCGGTGEPCPGLYFRPNANITRAQLTKITVNAEGWTITPPTQPTFRDVPATDPFYGFIETAYAHNIISGYACGTGCLEFRPGNSATRGQIAKIVYLAVTGP